MFSRLIALLMSLPLGLTLSAAAHAQPPIAGQTTKSQPMLEGMRQLIKRQGARIRQLEAEKSASATSESAAPAGKDTSPAAPDSSQEITASSKAVGTATENTTTEGKKKDDFANVFGLLIQLKAAAKIDDKKKDEQPLTERDKILLDRFEQMEKRLAEVESRLAEILSMDKCQRANGPTASALQPAVASALNATTAVPISDAGESSQAPSKSGGVGISPKFTVNSIPRWKNKKEPFAFMDSIWLTSNKIDRTDRADDVDNVGKSQKTGQSDKTNKGTAQASAGQNPPRRANPAPLDGVFPSTEYIGPSPLIGVPDTDTVYPLTGGNTGPSGSFVEGYAPDLGRFERRFITGFLFKL